MMSLNTKKCALVLGLSVAFATGSIFAAQEGNKAEKSADIKLIDEAISLLDKVELSSPKSYAEVNLIRKKLAKYRSLSLLENDGDSKGILFSRSGGNTTEYSRRNKVKRVNFYNSCRGLKDDELKAKLREGVSQHNVYDYKEARRLMYQDIDNRNGSLECVYTGKVVSLPAGKMPSGSLINCEHTWPQSKGATGDAKTDIHHLFPADPEANCKRGSFPFGYVNKRAVEYSKGGSMFDGDVFEVRKQHRGNVARAMFYFSTVYSMPIDPGQEKTLREWHKQDPVDANEIARNDRVESLQHNRNPFIDHPEYVDMIKDF